MTPQLQHATADPPRARPLTRPAFTPTLEPAASSTRGGAGVPRLVALGAAAALAFGLLLSLAFVFTRTPWWDEGLYADPARQFAQHGTLRSPLMGSAGSFGFADIPHMDRRTYWTTPLYPVVSGLWFKLVGVGLVQMRLLSLGLAVVLVGAWAAVVRRLTGSASVALVAAGLMALSSHVLWGASIGRPEALASSLATLGIAAYLRWREARLMRAATVAAALVTAGALAHPLAAVEGLGLVALALTRDWRRLRVPHVLAAAVVALLVLSPWLLYIAQDPAVFRAQWAANAQVRGGSRTGGLTDPLGALAGDFVGRYWQYSQWSVAWANRLLTIELATLGAALAAAFLVPAVRRQPGYRWLALLAVVGWAALAILDGSRYRQYFLHVYPAYLALAAFTLVALAERGRLARVGAAVLLAGLTLPGLLGWANNVRRNDYGTYYQTVAAAVRQHQRPGARVTGGSELAFALGFDAPLRDDMELHEPADLYVQSRFYDGFTRGHAVHGRLARDYRLVYANHEYRLFARRAPGEPAGLAVGPW